MPNLKDTIEALLAKAAEVHDSGDALRFSQAALNAANIKRALEPLEPLK